MKLRLAVVPVVIAAAAVAPSAANAAALSVDRACYGPNELLKLTGTGFTPNGLVDVAAGNQLFPGAAVANGVGVFSKGLDTPTITQRERMDTLNAVDATNKAIRATITARITRLRITLAPRRFRPGRRLRIRARGFTRGKSLYAHVRRGRFHRNIKIGRLKTCGVLSKKRKLLRRSAHTGRYKVQFDNKRHYSKNTRPAARFNIRVKRRRLLSSSSSASSSSVQTLWTEAK